MAETLTEKDPALGERLVDAAHNLMLARQRLTGNEENWASFFDKSSEFGDLEELIDRAAQEQTDEATLTAIGEDPDIQAKGALLLQEINGRILRAAVYRARYDQMVEVLDAAEGQVFRATTAFGRPIAHLHFRPGGEADDMFEVTGVIQAGSDLERGNITIVDGESQHLVALWRVDYSEPERALQQVARLELVDADS